jgi:hypothetical protein
MTSTNDEPTSIIIKSDRIGRSRYTQDYKDEVLTAYEASGMSGPAFAEHCGLKYPTFASWVTKRRRGEGPEPESVVPGSFVLAEFAPGSSDTGPLQVTLPGGAAVRLEEPGQIGLLAELIKALA